MVNTGLDRKYTAKEGGGLNFDPIPDGEYKLRVKEISDWNKNTKTLNVIQKDEKGNAIKNAEGKNLTEKIENCEFYNCMVKFEVVGGEYDGRLIFHNLTTHPNMDWSIPNFLFAIGLQELMPSQIKECVGKECLGTTFIDTYDKVVQNKETGIDETVSRNVNKIKSLKPLKTSETETNIDVNNLGI